METTLSSSIAARPAVQVTRARGIVWGLLGGMVGTFVMDLCLMAGLSAAGLSSLTCFSVVGDTVASFFGIFKLEMAGGVAFGVATHYIVGPAIGALFGAVVTKVRVLRLDGVKKSVALGALYVEILSQPLLATTPILLKMDASETIQWYGLAFLAHLIAGAVLGLVTYCGVRQASGVGPDRSGKGAASQISWWRGARGEWYVVAQVVMVALVFFGPRSLGSGTDWEFSNAPIASIAGGTLLVVGVLMVAAGILGLGANVTAVPFPKEQATLVQTGPYGFVRHPMYSGGIMIALGWALWVQGWLTVGYAIALFLFFDRKSRREEQWLKEKFPGYLEYQRRVRKLIPFVY